MFAGAALNGQLSLPESLLPYQPTQCSPKTYNASVETHTMGQSLSEYLRMKVHPLIHNTHWSRIKVKGEHQRDPSVVRISSLEKKDKPFNWQRPTASVVGTKTLQLHYFPGTDYVQHYAAILATYLSLK